MRTNAMAICGLVLAAGLVVLTGCSGSGSGSDGGATTTAPRATTTRSATGTATSTTASSVTDVAGPRDAAVLAACASDYATIHTAIETFRLTEGHEPASMADLVPGYVESASLDWQVARGPDGTAHIVRTDQGATDGCTVPAGG